MKETILSKDTIAVTIGDDHSYNCTAVTLGRTGENAISQLEITLPEELCSFWAYLDFKKPEGEPVRTPRLDIVNGVVEYDIPSGLLDKNGNLEVQLVLQSASGEVWKSAVKKYVVLKSIDAEGTVAEQQDFFTEAQKILDDMEEIAGSYQKPVSENGHAEGHNTKAGTKAFKITKEPSGTVGGVGYYYLDSVEGIEKGMRYSAVTSIASYDCGTITAIDKDACKVTVDNYSGHKLNTDVDDPSNYNLYNLFIIVDRPDLGTLDAGFNAHAEGNGTFASQADTHAEGRNTKALGKYAHTEGVNTAAGHASHAEGSGGKALGVAAHAEGQLTVAKADVTHAEGFKTKATAPYSHAEGFETEASGERSHAQGTNTKATAIGAHAEGYMTEATGAYSHAEGEETKATGQNAHAEGRQTKATAYASHAEGNGAQATGVVAHAEGQLTIASGLDSHAEGFKSKAEAPYSHAEGMETIAKTQAQHVQGKYNVADTENKYAHILGNGKSDTERSNAHTVDWEGNAWYAGDVLVGEDRVSLLSRIKELEGMLGSKELYPAAFAIWNYSGPIGSPTVGEPLAPNVMEPEATYRVAVTPGKSYRFTPTPQGGYYCYFAVGDAEGNCLFYTKESVSEYTVKESYDGKIPAHIYYGVKNIREITPASISFCEVGILEQLAQRVAALEAV